MVDNHHFTRIDTLELKDRIYRTIGPQRAEKYFDQLKRFFSLKLSKVEFDKNCIQTIGRENIALHNKLIQSIIHNACNSKTPPQKARKVEGRDIKVARNRLQSLYGDAFPRKCRSPVNKFRDRPSPLGPLGKSPSITCEETVTRIQDRSLVGVASVEDGEEVEQSNVCRWSCVSAPFGVSVNGRKGGYTSCKRIGETCESSGELPETGSLRSRLEKKLASEGVGVSMECANVLNNGLDVFLKRLIEPCVGIAGSRCRDSERQRQTSLRLLDFRVAMESNPRLLGEHWPVQLEKICQYGGASEE